MITEIAQIDVKPGSEKDFEAAVAKAKAAFGRSKGFHGFELHKSIEKPQRYRLMVKWATLENHTVDSAAPRISPNGAASSASILLRLPRSSTPRPC
ncbi:putative enzyme involved in biosynthesis of extracellular polysaccharides [Bradyrhizobium sp. YR681]|nr:putative enzyme involved in biosynthesis of extracellular polysaccharides [Bradyrhizobium sp. YR681]